MSVIVIGWLWNESFTCGKTVGIKLRGGGDDWAVYEEDQYRKADGPSLNNYLNTYFGSIHIDWHNGGKYFIKLNYFCKFIWKILRLYSMLLNCIGESIETFTTTRSENRAQNNLTILIEYWINFILFTK